ncbi:hypothetical protein PROFUN_10177 [Planoprotostelium fungivorum]|uniref:Uncharacterized protein n=1 Tax=Planoprotostelium fungivorum TaxID=1890364 RepID=A0A2P6NEP4_9EUKA|nr:hypothetical protein PROFUN_10177 [Planoprotostelium fungivorum]
MVPNGVLWSAGAAEEGEKCLKTCRKPVFRKGSTGKVQGLARTSFRLDPLSCGKSAEFYPMKETQCSWCDTSFVIH